MQIANLWKDYEIIDAGNGEKLERWGNVILRRPDGQVIWPIKNYSSQWDHIDAHYHRASTGGGEWEFKKKIQNRWTVKYKNLSFFVEPTGFKHTGLFPEQSVNWDWMENLISNYRLKNSKKINVLNLFAYTGAASIACASAGADVVHVDASKGMNEWAKENYELNGGNKKNGLIRFITDDVKKFVQREIRRGNKYEGIIMDPPVYGRGPKGELWEIEKEIMSLVEECSKLLSNDALFFVVNTYTASISPTSLNNLLKINLQNSHKGKFDFGEIALPITKDKMLLPCGLYARWERS